jgi:hypothetical protein
MLSIFFLLVLLGFVSSLTPTCLGLKGMVVVLHVDHIYMKTGAFVY